MMDIEGWTYTAFDDVIHSGYGSDLRVNCPFCFELDSDHHLYISLIKGVCHCFRCDYSNTLIGLVMDVDGIAFDEARDQLGGDIVPLYKLLRMKKDSVLGEYTMPKVEQSRGMPDNFTTINEALISGSKALYRSAMMALNYLTARMESLYDRADVCRRFGDQWGIWSGIEGYGWLVMPVEDGWWISRRLLRGMTPKYMACSKPKHGILYNYGVLDKCDEVAIAEGIFSAEFIGKHAIALCGKKATPEQLARLCEARCDEYSICLDAGTIEESLRLAEELTRRGKSVRIRTYYDGDPASSNNYCTSQYTLRNGLALKWGMT